MASAALNQLAKKLVPALDQAGLRRPVICGGKVLALRGDINWHINVRHSFRLGGDHWCVTPMGTKAVERLPYLRGSLPSDMEKGIGLSLQYGRVSTNSVEWVPVLVLYLAGSRLSEALEVWQSVADVNDQLPKCCVAPRSIVAETVGSKTEVPQFSPWTEYCLQRTDPT